MGHNAGRQLGSHSGFESPVIPYAYALTNEGVGAKTRRSVIHHTNVDSAINESKLVQR